MRALAECPVRAWLSRPEHIAELCRVARGYAGGGVLADDIASAAMERGLACSHMFRGGSVGAWMSQITRRLGLNAQRDARTLRRRVVSAVDLGDTPLEGEVDPVREWEGALLVDELRVTARAARLERAFARVVDEGARFSEVAREEGVSASTVGRRFAALGASGRHPAPRGPRTPQTPRGEG